MTPELLDKLRKRQFYLMHTTVKMLGSILARVTPQEVTTLRDGPDGWTTLEIVCHLRDFDGFFRGRAELILAQDLPDLPAYDHEALAHERAYNQQDMQQVYAELLASRQQTAAFFAALPDAAYERAGTHPTRGYFTLFDALVQVGYHDVEHIEQITRVLAQVQ